MSRNILKRKFIPFLICFCLMISLFMNINFVFASDDIFPDVPSDSYYSEAIYEMYKQGAIVGYSNGEFKPKNNITIAEVFTILYRLSNIEYEKNESSEFWYSDIINHAKKMNFLDMDVNPNDFATREDIAKFIISIYLIDTNETYVNNVFLDTNSVYANTMYQYGIFQGANYKNGYIFMPMKYITRGDLCLVLYRLNNFVPSPYINKIKIGNYEVTENPIKKEDIFLILKALGESGELSITIPYTKNLNDANFYMILRNNIFYEYSEIFSRHPELFSFTPSLNIKREINEDGSGKIKLNMFNSQISNADVIEYRGEFENKCNDIILNLYKNKELELNMSEKEKARVLFNYVVKNTTYDTDFNVLCFTGYGAAVDGLAVCQGYTAMFNKLCQIEGIEVEGVTGKIISTDIEHSWSRLKIDNKYVYCDPTFADSVPDIPNYCNEIYFDIEYDDLMRDRILDDFYIDGLSDFS